MRRLGGQVWQRASGVEADARASGVVDRPSRRSPESSEGRYARRADLVAWPAGLDIAGRGLARGQTLRKSMWGMVKPLRGGLTLMDGTIPGLPSVQVQPHPAWHVPYRPGPH